MNTLVTLKQRGSVGILNIDNPPVNAFSGAVVDALGKALDDFEASDSLKALIVASTGRTFVAGADIREFSTPGFQTSTINATLARIENQSRPVVAALHGTVLGAGLELAMACHYRIAKPTTQFGLPEVRLGILPGLQGTQRLPRLVGLELALDMILSGCFINVDKALTSGLIDRVQDGEIKSLAFAYAEQLIKGHTGPRRTRDLVISTKALPDDFFDRALSEAAIKKKHYPASKRIVECVQAAATMSFEEGAAIEAALFEECRRSAESTALRKLFFAERDAVKIPGTMKNTAQQQIKKVGVLGAGTMGGGIAMNFANANIPVHIVETSQEALDRGLAIVRQNYESSAAKGKISADAPAKRMELFRGSCNYDDLADCDLVIEAVYENLEVKMQVCKRLGEVCKQGAIIASNTSTLDVNILAQSSGRPSDFLGMHFFSPANVMRLLEIVRGDHTAPEVLNTVVKLAKSIGKVPVVSGVCYGFIGNRMLEPYLREAEFLLMEGATPSQIDGAIQSLGLPMGPCRMLDLAGLDVAAKVVIERGKAGGLPNDPSYRAVVRKMMEEGRLGQKSGLGYYRYDGRTAIHDPKLETICAELAKMHGIERRSYVCKGLAEKYSTDRRSHFTEDEIIERCLFPLINEGAKILEEGIAYRPGDIDLVWVNGYGFPDYRGGPMHYADVFGITRIAERLDHYARMRGNPFDYWTKSDLLNTMAAEGKRFSDWPFN